MFSWTSWTSCWPRSGWVEGRPTSAASRGLSPPLKSAPQPSQQIGWWVAGELSEIRCAQFRVFSPSRGGFFSLFSLNSRHFKLNSPFHIYFLICKDYSHAIKTILKTLHNTNSSLKYGFLHSGLALKRSTHLHKARHICSIFQKREIWIMVCLNMQHISFKMNK